VGADALKDSFFSSPTSPEDNPAQKTLHDAFNAEYKEGADKAFVDQTYDATFLALLAVEKAGSADKTKISKALIKEGKDIDYDGAGGAYEFDAKGDVTGYIGKFVVDGDKYKQVAVFQ
jgi:branched-chain amino acid transport system substrate-binding protein